MTTLSNFLTGYDKYTRTYNKEFIKESRYPGYFFLLEIEKLDIGIKKAERLLRKINKTHDRLVVIKSNVLPDELKANNITPTKLGEIVEHNWIYVNSLFFLENNVMKSVRIEFAIAEAYKTLENIENKYRTLKPRSISILPISNGCQAKCPFCFSSSSISYDQNQANLSPERVKYILQQAKYAGAERAVITGGGEPGLLELNSLLDLVKDCKNIFDKVVLITNGYFLSKQNDIEKTLLKLHASGLSVLSISRHHHNYKINSDLMKLETDVKGILCAYNKLKTKEFNFTIRWVCVLQKGGIDSTTSLQDYIDWAFECGVEQICFKELYVSSSTESPYYDHTSNQWSFDNQVPLSLVTNCAEKEGWKKEDMLPWGSPIYRITKDGNSITVAAYTEPSVSWELHNNLCRSWNLLADGRCYASLETLESEVLEQEGADNELCGIS